jgi:predicted metal-dependent hydrolase
MEGRDLSACPEAPKSRLLLQGLEQFNRGEFIRCHESLEKLWVSEQGSIRELYKGILQISVAFHHLRERRYQSAVMLLGRGAAYLERFSPRCIGGRFPCYWTIPLAAWLR